MANWFTNLLRRRPIKRTETRGRRTDRYDKPLEMGVCVPQDFRFDNELEQYAYYLELKLRFYEYEHLTDAERDAQHNMIEQRNAELPTKDVAGYLENIKRRDCLKILTIPDCRFDCGTAPCNCHSQYDLFKKLEKRYRNGLVSEGVYHYWGWFNVERIIEMIDTGKKWAEVKTGNANDSTR